MRSLAVVALFFASAVASATEPYHTENIMLLQPEFVLEKRVPSVKQLSDYIKAVQTAASTALSGTPQSPVIPPEISSS